MSASNAFRSASSALPCAVEARRRRRARGIARQPRSSCFGTANPAAPSTSPAALPLREYLRRLDREIAARWAALAHSHEEVDDERAALLDRRRDRKAIETLLDRRLEERAHRTPPGPSSAASTSSRPPAGGPHPNAKHWKARTHGADWRPRRRTAHGVAGRPRTPPEGHLQQHRQHRYARLRPPGGATSRPNSSASSAAPRSRWPPPTRATSPAEATLRGPAGHRPAAAPQLQPDRWQHRRYRPGNGASSPKRRCATRPPRKR